ncbi:MAG: hypothetical protein A2583_15720 [Bdellovibrionales bacterium RIFOXYD1_FULL_53_11]|nr:MAG: hypothetical protein A2583_15720 [Bdellovibrionales bacterium RIFOXYD1_FULL_53_11]
MIISQQFNLNATKNLAKGVYRYLGKETNYSDIRTKIAKLSYLYLSEVGPGARVAFVARNCPAYITTLFALSNCRSVIIPVDPNKPPEEVLAWLKDSKATHVAVTGDLVGPVRDIMMTGHINLPIIEMEKKQGGEYATSFTPPPDNPPNEMDQIVLFRTAGNTGKPKFVGFNHKQLTGAASALKGPYHVGSTDRFYTNLSWAHPYAFMHAMFMPLMTGSTVIIDHGLEGKDLLDFLVESRVSRMVSIPSFYLKVLLTCRDEKRRVPAAVKSATVGLGPLHPEVRKTLEMMNIAVTNTYGLAEACWTVAMEDTRKEGAEEAAYGKKKRPKPEAAKEAPAGPQKGIFVGKGLAGLKYKVIDAGGDEITGGEEREGLFCITGPSMMSGYFENDKDSKQTIRGTWLYTGEYAKLEGEGETLKITFLARREDGIRNGNEILIPNLIDKFIKGVPGVFDGAGFVLKNSKNEQKFVVAAVKNPGSLSEKQILDHLASQLPSDLVPVAVVFTDSIPRDTGGNVNRYRLAAQFSGSLG